jgi:hypothetical protein
MDNLGFVIAMALLPLGILFYRVVPRLIVELLWRYAPEGKFKELLTRDRASRTKSRE